MNGGCAICTNLYKLKIYLKIRVTPYNVSVLKQYCSIPVDNFHLREKRRQQLPPEYRSWDQRL